MRERIRLTKVKGSATGERRLYADALWVGSGSGSRVRVVPHEWGPILKWWGDLKGMYYWGIIWCPNCGSCYV